MFHLATCGHTTRNIMASNFFVSSAMKGGSTKLVSATIHKCFVKSSSIGPSVDDPFHGMYNSAIVRNFHQTLNLSGLISRDHVRAFEEIFAQDKSTHKKGGEVLYSPDSIDLAFNADWTGQYRGSSELVLRPRTTQQVSKIVQYCNENNIAIVPQGGNTGLVGAGK